MNAHFATGADSPRDSDVVVVVDVLRAFTFAAIALDRGAKEVQCVREVDEAVALRDTITGSLAAGEVDRGQRIAGFDLTNSPASLDTVRLDGRTLIQRTSAGTQGLVKWAPHAQRLYACAFVNVAATASAVLRGFDEVVFVLTGADDRDGDEDRACAEYAAALIEGRSPHVESYLDRVRASDAARSFRHDSPDMPPTDVHVACSADTVDFAVRGHPLEARVRLSRE